MRTLFTIAVLTAALTSAVPAGAQDATSEAAIRAIVAAQVEAWNAGNGAEFARRIAPDVTFTNLFGAVTYGAPAFTQRQIEILGTFYNGTTKVHALRRIRFVTADVALVDIDNEVRGVKTLPSGIALPPDGVVKSQLLQVFVRRDGEWWIEAFHNVDLKTPPK
jgi:uncharacterized protein (TIGR02246 family)